MKKTILIILIATLLAGCGALQKIKDIDDYRDLHRESMKDGHNQEEKLLKKKKMHFHKLLRKQYEILKKKSIVNLTKGR